MLCILIWLLKHSFMPCVKLAVTKCKCYICRRSVMCCSVPFVCASVGAGKFGTVYSCINMDTYELMAVKQVSRYIHVCMYLNCSLFRFHFKRAIIATLKEYMMKLDLCRTLIIPTSSKCMEWKGIMWVLKVYPWKLCLQ